MGKLRKKDVRIGEVVLDGDGDLMVKTGDKEWKLLVPGDSIFYSKELIQPLVLVRHDREEGEL